MTQFLDYLSKYGKQYSSDEEFKRRFALFKATLRQIEAHPGIEKVGWSAGLSHLSDYDESEKMRLLGALPEVDAPLVGANISPPTYSTKSLPLSVSWMNIQTPVK